MKFRTMFISGLFTIMVFGCATTTQLAWSGAYSVNTQVIEDIRGDYKVERFLLYRRSVIDTHLLTVDRFIFEDERPTMYAMSVRYAGSSWQFLETILVKTDGDLFELTDTNPTRNVKSGGNVEEVIGVPFPEGLYDALMTTEVLTVQFHHDPITIEPEGVTRLKQFLQEQEPEAETAR